MTKTQKEINEQVEIAIAEVQAVLLNVRNGNLGMEDTLLQGVADRLILIRSKNLRLLES